MPELSNPEFELFRRFIHRTGGISLAPSKAALVSSRLSKRLRVLDLNSFEAYHSYITDEANASERQLAIDLLTTNETYFFREPEHFALMRDRILPGRTPGRTFRLWSAACSTGEEPYSLAMLLDDVIGPTGWEILASDLSASVLTRASSGRYELQAREKIPEPYLRRYCLRGTGEHEGTMMIKPALRAKLSFRQINLNEALPEVGEFDVIFLRNVMIYFDDDTKRQVVDRLAATLRPGGHFIIGHSEVLDARTPALKKQRPSVFSRVRASL